MIVKTTKLNYKGQATAQTADKQLLVWNALPNEKVKIEIVKRKGDLYHAVATEVLKKSSFRVRPIEKSFLSTSPWQIIRWEQELNFKKSIFKDLLKTAELKSPSKIDIFTNNIKYGYRNKMEFSFVELSNGSISLAFFRREGKRKIEVNGSKLAEPIINETAKTILQWVNEQKIPIRSLKTLVVRSNGEGQGIAGLFIKDELTFKKFPKLNTNFLGLQIFYSTHKSPASVPTKLLYSFGTNELSAVINGTRLRFGLFSFFQINIPVFVEALNDIAGFLTTESKIIDYYSGVGSISLGLKSKVSDAVLVENNEEAIEFAEENIATAKAKDFKAILSPSEKTLDYIQEDRIIIFDPPRTGLHKKVIERVREIKPNKIIYLSCGPETQIRDIGEIKDLYDIKFIRLYNFFPRTPHFESLVLLERRN